MIYTVTFNPSIDCVVYLDSFTNGMTNRTTSEEYYIGGKGINVSYVLSELDIKNTALGFSAGFTGDAIEKELKTKGIAADFIRLKNGISRINFKIKTDKESEINCQGPKIGEDEFGKLIEKMDMITDGDTLVLAGSIPNTFSSDAYEKIIKKLDGKDVRVVVDAEKRFLLDLLKYKPFLIKPNKQELCEIFDAEIEDETDIELYARKLREMGA
ncbi:MAG: hexose kinase, partial [Ruminococcus sp.]|nr:hexose kinase [Ruminococcus sp.]